MEALPPKGYTLAWSDEFDGDQLDETKWTYRTDSKHWSTQKQENVEVSDGALFLHLKKEALNGKEYTGSGIIRTSRFKYGYYESRFRVPPGAGWHTSFWLMKEASQGGTEPEDVRQEIDICEQDSVDSTSFSVNLHDWENVNSPDWEDATSNDWENESQCYGEEKIKTDDLSKAFHFWGCEFTKTHIRYYFDGRLVQETDATLLNHDTVIP